MKQKKTKPTDTRPELLKKCIDILKTEYSPEVYEMNFIKVIDTLSDYPKPRQKGDNPEIEPTSAVLGAFLYVSNTRNALTLGIIKLHTPETAYLIALESINRALKLIDN